MIFKKLADLSLSLRFSKKIIQAKPYPKVQPEIKKIIDELIENRTIVAIEFADYPQIFSSIILEHDLKNNQLIFDELMPKYGSVSAENLAEFTLTSKLPSKTNSNIEFVSKFVKVGMNNSVPFYVAKCPEHIEYIQQRRAKRTQTPHSLNINVDFFVPLQPLINAKVKDLSATGMRFVIPNNQTKIFKRNTIIEDCHLNTPVASIQDLTIEIKHIEFDWQNRQTIIGCQFINLDNNSLKFLGLVLKELGEFVGKSKSAM